MKNRHFSLVAALLAVTALAVLPVAAQTTVIENGDLVATSSWLHGTWEFLQPIAAVFLTAAASAIAGTLVALLVQLLRRAGIEIEEADRKRLHEGAENALKSAIAKYVGPVPNMINGTVPKEIMDLALEYLKSKNPEGTAKLSDKNLTDIILSKVPQVSAIVAASQSGSGKGPGTVEVGKASTTG